MEYKSLPDLKYLATLRAVVEQGGVNTAARSMNIGQPAVTKRLRALESCYGIDLVERRGGRLSLTEAGERVYAFARLALDHQALLLEDLAAMHTGRNSLRLEVSLAIGEHLLPDLLLRFAAAHPEYHIVSRMGYGRRIQTRLATGLADLALLEQAPDHPEVLVQKWLDDEILLVCGAGHRLAGVGMLSLDELASLSFVLREKESAMRLTLDKVLGDVGIGELRVIMEVGSTDTIVEMLGQGAHLSFLPRFAVAESLAQQRLHRVKIRGLRIMRTLWIARTRSNLNNPVIEAFIELLRQPAGERLLSKRLGDG